MTRAPDNLLAVRKLLLAHLDIDKTRARSIDLESEEVGIVGDSAHQAQGDSYHLGRPEQNPSGSYSIRESSRDAALTEYACALDVGGFTVKSSRGTFDLAHFSAWCVAQCKAGATDTRDIREIIWSPDGKVVRRWDRLGRRTTGDSSHRWHTHFSFHRDAIKAGRDQTGLFRRYLTHIGLLEDDMATFTDAHARVLEQLGAVLPKLVEQTGYTDARNEAYASGRTTVRKDLRGGGSPVWLVQAVMAIRDGLAQVDSKVGAQLADDFAKIEAAVAAAGDADAQRDQAAGAQLADVIEKLRQLADLVSAGQSGQLAADEVLRRMGEVLTAGTTGPQAG
ncbi:hypothetical protein ACGFIY_21425 [Micromonospora chersina]|uniref:hypothetical protein n=1 Tax=Micromonospora chersina TaxID=47854 RepID=UPI0037142604